MIATATRTIGKLFIRFDAFHPSFLAAGLVESEKVVGAVELFSVGDGSAVEANDITVFSCVGESAVGKAVPFKSPEGESIAVEGVEAVLHKAHITANVRWPKVSSETRDSSTPQLRGL